MFRILSSLNLLKYRTGQYYLMALSDFSYSSISLMAATRFLRAISFLNLWISVGKMF